MNTKLNPYSLPPELLDVVRTVESDLRKWVQHVEGRYLVYRQVNVLKPGAPVEITGADLLAVS